MNELGWALVGAGILLTAVQVLLCFWVKPVWIRLLPLILMAGAAAGFLIAAKLVSGWDAILWLGLALIAVVGVAAVALAWSIWGLTVVGRKARQRLEAQARP